MLRAVYCASRNISGADLVCLPYLGVGVVGVGVREVAGAVQKIVPRPAGERKKGVGKGEAGERKEGGGEGGSVKDDLARWLQRMRTNYLLPAFGSNQELA